LNELVTETTIGMNVRVREGKINKLNDKNKVTSEVKF